MLTTDKDVALTRRTDVMLTVRTYCMLTTETDVTLTRQRHVMLMMQTDCMLTRDGRYFD